MPGTARSRELKLRTIRDLDRIADVHLRWMRGYHRVLLCGDATAPDVHCACSFGLWYGQIDPTEHEPWRDHLRHIEALHRQMHESAVRLARVSSQAPVAIADYERFAEHAYRFETAMRALQMKLMDDVCLIDHLTGVWNRSSLAQRLSDECERVLRHGGSCCLCMMDIDHFKVVNDRHGHVVGDRVLQTVAGIVQQRLRRSDSIFRYGGEEFLICLPRTSVDEALASMERIRVDIAAATVVEEGVPIRVTASFGIAELRPEAGIESGIESADQALFMAKTGGRNRSCRL
ncbi:MAG: diguanylate cyclase [Rhodocyclaceae bacterium]|nr:diguanylate cyclase [Rhodocyclaceae bacterium]